MFLVLSLDGRTSLTRLLVTQESDLSLTGYVHKDEVRSGISEGLRKSLSRSTARRPSLFKEGLRTFTSCIRDFVLYTNGEK